MRASTLRLRESFWFLPAVFGVVAIVLAQALVALDRTLIDSGVSIPFLDALSASGGRSILTTIGTAMLTVAGTSFSITISVLATTSSTYGPRLVRNFMADRANQFVLASFTATFLYAIVVLRSVHTAIEDSDAFVPVVAVHVAVLLGVLDVGVLVFFIHHIAASVQITAIQHRVQQDLIATLDEPFGAPDDVTTDPVDLDGTWTSVLADQSGYVQSVALDRLCRVATNADTVVDVVAMPGNHVIEGDVLARLRAPLETDADTDTDTDTSVGDAVRRAVVVGTSRTPEQDVRFALQQLIEVAVRGLASGSNDPYTAVTALDMTAGALVPVWRDGRAWTARVVNGRPRVICHWASAEELVDAVFATVETYGGGQPIVIEAAVRLAQRLEDCAPEDRRGHMLPVMERLRASVASTAA